MRLRRIALGTTFTVLAGLSTLLGPAASSARAADPAAVPLPIPHVAHMLVDAAHQHLFFSEGEGNNGVLVTDFAGNTVTTIPDEQGSEGMTLSADGSTLYVALKDGDAVSAIDTSTLAETQRYSLGAGNGAQFVAIAGDKLWVSYGSDSWGEIGSIDLSTSPATLALGQAGWSYPPFLASSPAAPGVLMATEAFVDPPTLTRYDVSSGKLVEGASLWSAGGGTMTFTPDGLEVVSVSREYRVSDLSVDSTYVGIGGDPAIAPDGTIAVTRAAAYPPDVYVYAPHGAVPLSRYEVAVGDNEVCDAPAWAPDESRLFVVRQSSYSVTPGDRHPMLNVLVNPELPQGWLALTYAPSVLRLDQGVTLRGTLTSTAPLPPGQTVRVTRSDAGHPTPVPLPGVITAADGSFTIRDVPASAGTYLYTVSYAGDATHAPTSVLASVRVLPLPTSLSITTDARAYGYGGLVKVTAHLATSHTNRSLEISAPGYRIRTGTVDAHGNLVEYFHVNLRATFSALFVGDDRYAPATAQVTVGVRAGVSETLSGYYASVSKGGSLYRVFHHTQQPTLTFTVTPIKLDETAVFRVQEYVNGAWRPVITSPLYGLSNYSRTVYHALLPNTAVGHLFRIDGVYQGDPYNLSTAGAWQYFTIRW